jgi:hypothetical protein
MAGCGLRQHVFGGFAQFAGGDVFDYACVADADGKNKASDAANVFLIRACGCDQPGCAGFKGRQSAVVVNQLFQPI